MMEFVHFGDLYPGQMLKTRISFFLIFILFGLKIYSYIFSYDLIFNIHITGSDRRREPM